ncbi:MAG: GIY-YIG nuclease family protein [Cyclobacteriaceae bacterium]|nr:GIY-YIG nuclease family protein [Cyclobacteriaceae bacterium HetDA_MAG_MS6]
MPPTPPSSDTNAWFVYILKCYDGTFYVGCTNDILKRIKQHNQKQIHYTKSRLPLKLVSYTAFTNKYTAYQFEKYMKSGSGRAFAKRHFLQNS